MMATEQKEKIEDLKNLLPGGASKEYIKKLYFFMRPTSDDLKKAVIKHLCDGITQPLAAEECGVKQGNISRQVKRLKEVNAAVLEIAECVCFQSLDEN